MMSEYNVCGPDIFPEEHLGFCGICNCFCESTRTENDMRPRRIIFL